MKNLRLGRAVGLGMGVSLLASCFLTQASSAQEPRQLINPASVPQQGQKASDFVPAGWQLESQISGDLNADGKADLALKLVQKKQSSSEEQIENRERALVIAFQTAQGKYQRATVARTVLQCTACGGAFYGVMTAPAEISIVKGVLIVNQDHGSRNVSHYTIRFRYAPARKRFELIGLDYHDYDRLTLDTLEESSNFLTGDKIIVTRKTDPKTEKVSTSTQKLKIAKSQLPIEQFDYENASAY